MDVEARPRAGTRAATRGLGVIVAAAAEGAAGAVAADTSRGPRAGGRPTPARGEHDGGRWCSRRRSARMAASARAVGAFRPTMAR